MRRGLLCTSLIVICLLLPFSAFSAERVRPTGRVALPRLSAAVGLAELQTLCRAEGKMYGAGRGQIALINENGSVQSRFQSPVESVAGIAAYQPGKLIVGDSARRCVYVFDLATNHAQTLLNLSEVSQEGFHAGNVLTSGELASVASDGDKIFVGMRAGFSSSLFLIDPNSKRILAHGWAPGDDPSALAFQQGRLFVLDGKGRQLRSLQPDLRPVYTWLNVPVENPRGIVIDADRIRVVRGSSNQISVVKTELGRLVQASITAMQPVAVHVIPGAVAVIPRKFAVLICGDVAESGAAFNCFWNDTYWMYQSLLAKGFTKSAIYVLYGNGADWNCANPRYKPPAGETVTDFPATVYWVNKVFDGLKNGDAANGITKMRNNDTLFLWTFDHGAGGNPAYLCLMDGYYRDSDFAAKVNQIPCSKRLVFMQQCHSGGFIDNLTSTKTFISTACTANQSAFVGDEYETYGGVKYRHGEYNYHIISALGGATPTGSSINADSNGNSKVSVLEMHNWEAAHENSAGETPQLNDPGSIGATSHLVDY